MQGTGKDYDFLPAVRKFSRRRALAASGLGASAALGAACRGGSKQTAGSGSQGSSAGQGAKGPKKGGVLNYAGGPSGSYDVQGTTFDPDIQTQFASKSFGLFYQRLLAYDQRTYAVQPELAQKWEQPSQTEYVLHLQPGVKWHDKAPVNGREFTANDVVWSLERARTNDPKFYTRSFLSSFDTIEAPDKATVRVTTKGPDASTLTKLSIDNLAMLAREVFEATPKPTTADSAVGTGPFVMRSVEEKVAAEYVRNPNYWKVGLPYLDGFRTRNFPDASTAYAAFVAGQIDISPLPGSEVKAYLAKRPPGFTPDWYADDTFIFQYPNTKRKPMDDPRVTRALRLLVDHDEFISAWANVLYGRGGIGSIFPTALGEWDLSEAEYKQQLEWKQPKDDAAKEALSLLAAAGFTKDNPLKFTLDSQTGEQSGAGSQLVQAQWKRLSQGVVDVQLKLSDQATVNSIRASRSFTYALLGQSAGMVDPDIWLGAIYRSDGSQNFMGFNDPQADMMIDKQRGIFDATQRKAAVKQIVLYMIEHGVSTIGANRYFLQAVQAGVQNHVPEYYLNGHQYGTVWLDK